MSQMPADNAVSTSSKSPRRPWPLPALMLAAVVAVALAVILYFSRVCLPAFHVVRQGVLYRSAQPKGLGFWWARRHGVRTIVNLRDPALAVVDLERDYYSQHGIRFYNIHLRSQTAVVEDAVAQFLAIMDKAAADGGAVLVHCARGKERSGVLCAVFRMEYDRWPNDKAIAELYALGLKPGTQAEAEDFLRRYSPRWAAPAPAALPPPAAPAAP